MNVDTSFNPLIGTFELGHANRERPVAPVQSSKDDVVAMPFDVASDLDWRALLRDITAFANSGGGKQAIRQHLEKDEILRRMALYGVPNFHDIAALNVEYRNDRSDISVITVGPAKRPIEFCGIVFFRHGDRSGPATALDVGALADRSIAKERRRWLRGIRRVLRSRRSDRVGGCHKKLAPADAALKPVRIVNDPSAPALHPQDVDRLYPWRQKDLVHELNRRLGRRTLNSYDIQAVRRHHRLDERPDFIFNLPGAGRRYSPAAADWILAEYVRDAEFFRNARIADQENLKLRRRKPK
jgi:hypothetical protein